MANEKQAAHVGEVVYVEERPDEPATVREVYMEGRHPMAIIEFADGGTETRLQVCLMRAAKEAGA